MNSHQTRRQANHEMEAMLAGLRQSWLESLPERLDELEMLVMRVGKPDHSKTVREEIFRQVHSLKGSGGTHGLHVISTICHQFEDCLEKAGRLHDRDGQDFVELALGYVDLLRQAYHQVMADNTDTGQIESMLDDLCRKAYGKHHARVLLVGSGSSQMTLCSDILERQACNVVRVEDGVLALQRAVHERFDLLVTGYENSGLNGIALIAACRLSDAPACHLRTILMSSNPGHEGLAGNIGPHAVVMRDKSFISTFSAAIECQLASIAPGSVQR